MTQSPADALKEQIARIVDPNCLWDLAGVPGFPLADHYAHQQERALAVADAILALPALAAALEKSTAEAIAHTQKTIAEAIAAVITDSTAGDNRIDTE